MEGKNWILSPFTGQNQNAVSPQEITKVLREWRNTIFHLNCAIATELNRMELTTD
jgi:hypothetical protein